MASNSFQESATTIGPKAVCLLGNPAGFKLFFNERDSDVSIRVEYDDEKWQFPAHKLVLCTMSEVFRTMLEVDMLEKHTKTVIIRDSNPHTVKLFLKYLYMGIVEFIDWYEAISLLKIAHKYSVHTLIILCENYLSSNVSFHNVCLLYEVAKTYSLTLLEKGSRDFILEAGFIVYATHGFFNLKPCSIEYFLSSPLFNTEKEGCVLTSLMEWAVCECTRKRISLTRTNVLGQMEPFLKLIQWNLIPECDRTYVPKYLVNKNRNRCLIKRKQFYVPSALQNQIHHIKCSVELGYFHQENFFSPSSTPCLKFSVDNHVFFVGFRIIGLFPKRSGHFTAPKFLVLSRNDGKVFLQLDLMSLPWMKGATVENRVWKEITAYLPYPVRIDPFYPYILSLRSVNAARDELCVKWPVTRLDKDPISTNFGTVSFSSHGSSYGITQLFILPAPPYRNVCNFNPDDLFHR